MGHILQIADAEVDARIELALDGHPGDAPAPVEQRAEPVADLLLARAAVDL